MIRKIAAAAILLFSPAPMPAQHPGVPHWTYQGDEGPSHWGDLDPSYSACKAGASQSPIDIRGAAKKHLDALEFHYQDAPLRILDNGHTIVVNYEAGSTLSIAGHTYVLKQFHFHHPSEEKIKGKSSDMVVHLVHADAEGKLAVVAVLLKKGHANPAVESIWSHLPSEKGKETTPEGATINAAALLPAHRAYYTYAGSLTTPPCSETVTWFVLRESNTVSASQLSVFDKVYPMNARPTQPLNGRVVSVSN